MPIYEYRCIDCEREFEALVSATFPKPECPHCKGVNLSRELSVFASARSDASGGSAIPAQMSGGGCCGGGCGCRR